MGILDSTTTNVSLDVVLTIKGRELISRADGSFKISKFAIGDDEVDYSIIQGVRGWGFPMGRNPRFEILEQCDFSATGV
jgi:hypothetical protein